MGPWFAFMARPSPRAMDTSSGPFKKTHKTAFNADVGAALPFFETHVNREILDNAPTSSGPSRQLHLALTVTHLKNATPEEFLAQMDPDRSSRCYFGICVCHSLFTPWAELLGLWRRQGPHGIAERSRFEVGRVSKPHRDTERDLGKC